MFAGCTLVVRHCWLYAYCTHVVDLRLLYAECSNVRILYVGCTHIVRMLYACCTHVVRILYACCTPVVRWLYTGCILGVHQLYAHWQYAEGSNYTHTKHFLAGECLYLCISRTVPDDFQCQYFYGCCTSSSLSVDI